MAAHSILYSNIFAIPNGGFRHITTARKLKAEGVRPGVPDVFVGVPRFPHAGLFLEFKMPKGVVSAVQATWADRLQTVGYAYAVVRSVDEAIETTEGYLRS